MNPQTGSLISELAETVAAAEVTAGDEILIPALGCLFTVSSVTTYDDGRTTIVYFAHDETTFENKARDKSGMNTRRRLVEKSLQPIDPHTEVSVVRGSSGYAETLRARMLDEQADRWRRSSERRAIAQARDEARRA